MTPALPRVAVVVGPTAAGKTALALDLAEALGAEIVGADSVQVYRGMDIGSAKATAAERARVPHHLLDVAAPDEPFDARRYAALAAQAIADIAARGRRPLVVGGTGLYLRALLEGLMDAPAADPQVRRRLEEQGAATLHARLADVDPRAAGRIHPADRVRIVRALEVHALTGRPMSDHQAAHGFAGRAYDALWLGLDVPRDELNRRIDARVRAMFAQGLQGEVAALLAAGHPRSLRPLGALGYKHACALAAGEVTQEEAVERTQRDTRRFGKRQMTWFRRVPGVRWVRPPWDVRALADLLRAHFEAAP